MEDNTTRRNTLEDDFVETFITPESRKSAMFRFFAKGLDIEGVDRNSPLVKELLDKYETERID